MSRQLSILVHGFNKNRNDMAYLEAGLKNLGFEVLSVNLPTTFGTVQQCVNSLYLQINELVREVDVVNYVAHSIGGLITRFYIASTKQENVGKCVFIATPHKGSRLAKIANYIPLYSSIFRPVKDLLPEAGYTSFNLDRDFRIGLIAGSKNMGILGNIFLSSMSDGRVDVSSVEAEDADECIVLPFGHKEIHHKQQTLIAVRNFLLSGTFVNGN